MLKHAVILAGGLGTRLREVISDCPKPMALINNRPFLEYLFDFLVDSGITDVVLSVGYKNEIISQHFNNRYRSLKIRYSVEDKPLGTGGAVKKALAEIESKSVLVLNGDTIFRINLINFYKQYVDKSANVMIAIKKLDNSSRYGTVNIDKHSRITGFLEKSNHNNSGLINGGIYIINKSFFQNNSPEGKFSIEKDFFEKLHHTDNIFGFISNEYFLDIGIPKDLKIAENEFTRFEY